ncbi:MAG: Co2+/Mg2+ efflux protein ApaG [Pseudomonadales bacterium]|nr:Co2+/Mg2+ efflux protein ApaG [Halioglobus sp.]MCP5123101.1 Co2+/Mg2+ efflux protein ApaG [Pseudomonadales bacterium]
MDNADKPHASAVGVHVVTTYLPGHSRPDHRQYAFAYTITISNGGEVPVQLLSRHWIITDADSGVQEVRGEGVVGEQPLIAPGKSFRYTSGATLATPVGSMEGSYTMVYRDNAQQPPSAEGRFQVPIPAFSLHTPTALH